MKYPIEQIAHLESDILKHVRGHPGISRVALARELKISPSTVGNYVARLCAEGFLIESKRPMMDAGRPPTALRLNSEGGQLSEWTSRRIISWPWLSTSRIRRLNMRTRASRIRTA